MSVKKKLRLKVVTLARLKKMGACRSAQRVFQREFGKQARITATNLDRAEDVGLSLKWLAEALELVPRHEFGAAFGAGGRCARCDVERKVPNYVRRALLRAARG